MINYQEYSCPVCHRVFSPTDDIVVCPECGAPHHRECWKAIGHCTFAEAHGTPDQWQPLPSRSDDDVLICGNCGTANAQSSSFCRKCGHSLTEQDASLSENPEDAADSDKPVTTDMMDMATFVGPHSEYYLSRFAWIEKNKNRMTWNLWAMIFPVEWLLYRKMYRLFTVAFAVMLTLMIPSLLTLVYSFRAVAGDTAAMEALLSSGALPAASIPNWLNTLSNISSLLSLFIRGLFSLKANDFYRLFVHRRIAEIRRQCADPLYYRYALSKKGGTSVTAVVLYLVAFCGLSMVGAFLVVILA